MENNELNNNISGNFNDSSSSSSEDVENVPLQAAGFEEASAVEDEGVIEEMNVTTAESESMLEETNITSEESNLKDEEMLETTTETNHDPNELRESVIPDLEDSSHSSSFTSVSSLSYTSQLASEQLGPADQALQKLKLDACRVLTPLTDSSSTTSDSLPEDQKDPASRSKLEHSSSERIDLKFENKSAGEQDKTVSKFARLSSATSDSSETTDSLPEDQRNPTTKNSPAEGLILDTENTKTRRDEAVASQITVKHQEEDTGKWAATEKLGARSSSSGKDCTSKVYEKIDETASGRKRTYIKTFPSSSVSESSRKAVDERKIKRVKRSSSISETIRVTPSGAHKRTVSAPSSSKSGSMKSSKKVKFEVKDKEEEDSNSDSSGSE